MMEKSTVYIFSCKNYNIDEIYRKISLAVEDMGGINSILNYNNMDNQKKVLLKPNLLAPEKPDRATTTHPAVFEAVARFMKGAGFEVYYGDSPAFHSTETTAKKAGIAEVADRLGIIQADFESSSKVFAEEARQNKYFNIAKGVAEIKNVISLPKLKTHGLTILTGAVKNQFGCIPGRQKSSYHVKLDNIERFSQMLVDLTMLIKPKLYIMDAIVAMEGNGPHRGKPVNLGVLLISKDPVAMDSVACGLIGLNPQKVKTVVLGERSGLGTMNNIEVKGDIELKTIKKFSLPRRDVFISLPKWTRNLIEEFLISKPIYDYSKCIKCYECYEICPTRPKSIRIKDDGFPAYNYRTCIKCYCCQETCPTGAIYLKISPFRR